MDPRHRAQSNTQTQTEALPTPHCVRGLQTLNFVGQSAELCYSFSSVSLGNRPASRSVFSQQHPSLPKTFHSISHSHPYLEERLKSLTKFSSCWSCAGAKGPEEFAQKRSEGSAKMPRSKQLIQLHPQTLLAPCLLSCLEEIPQRDEGVGGYRDDETK